MAADSGTGCDFLVIGGGIAGASAAYELAARGEVVLLERESQPGYHSTGRSAAIYTETYGNAMIRAITTGGRSFLTDPPSCFGDNPLMAPRGVLFIGRADQAASLDGHYAEASRLVDSVRRLDRKDVLALVPVLRDDYIAGGVYEPDATDLDVAALHQGFLRGMRQRGGRVVTDAEVIGLVREAGRWCTETPAGTFKAPVVVNAASPSIHRRMCRSRVGH
jgi:D-arginine dehydrogenase